jgi:NADH-quinone oxidoreductase subunit A
MIESYLPVFFQIIIAIAIAVGAIVLSLVLGKSGRTSIAKDTAYECGKDAITTNQPRFSVKFYIIAMIFILFDIEVIFSYPWAIAYRELISTSLNALWAMLVFVLIVEVGHFYAYKKGVFDWNK